MTHTHTFRTWDDHVIPGTVVLRNKFTASGKPYGEPDAAKLRTLEETAAAFRIQELYAPPVAGRFVTGTCRLFMQRFFKTAMSGLVFPVLGRRAG